MCTHIIFSGQPSEQDFYEEDLQLPIYERIPSGRKRLYTTEEIVRILLKPDRVCTKVPCSIACNVTFVVDTSKLGDKEDATADDMGVWKNNRVDTGYVRVSMAEDEITQVEKCSIPTSHSSLVYTVKRVYRTHGTNLSLRKLTASLYGE